MLSGTELFAEGAVIAVKREPSRSGMAWFLVLLAALGAILSEAGRVILKGPDYAYERFNDIYYYTAMVFNLWSEPVTITQELAELELSMTPEETKTFYGGGDPFWATHVHAENGLSHQPPWSYRLLVPMLGAGLRTLGVSLTYSFLLVYVASAVILVLSVFFLLRPQVVHQRWAALISLGVLGAGLAATSPGYPDLTFLALAMWAVLLAYQQRSVAFFVVAFMAGLTRETALLLVVTWVMVSWANHRRLFEIVAFALSPLLGVFMARILVEVPNPSIDYVSMVRGVEDWPPAILWALAPAVLVGLISPTFFKWLGEPKLARLPAAEAVSWSAGILFVLATGLAGLASSRMALLALPLLIAPQSWLQASSRFWLISGLAALGAYALSDTLAFRSDPIFGQWPWLVGVCVVVLSKLFAVSRQRSCQVQVRH